jgi:putative transposase
VARALSAKPPLVSERRRFGYWRLGYLLAREGLLPKHKKRRRIYR